MIRTIIIDDDVYHLRALETILKQNFKQVEILTTSMSVPDAVEKINAMNPHLVFLDIEMEPYSGFDFLEMVEKRNFEVIFTTAYQHYAIQAVKASALDYIKKPVTRQAVDEALSRYKSKSGVLKLENLLNNFKLSNENQKIALYDNKGINFFEVKRIIYCQSDNTYTTFFIQNEIQSRDFIKIQVSKGLNQFEDFLIETGIFFRVHNQHIVNINFIKRFVKTDGSYLTLNGLPCVTIPIARARKDDFLNFLRSKGVMI
jgi:two-component system, LytTR family, response regulator